MEEICTQRWGWTVFVAQYLTSEGCEVGYVDVPHRVKVNSAWPLGKHKLAVSPSPRWRKQKCSRFCRCSGPPSEGWYPHNIQPGVTVI